MGPSGKKPIRLLDLELDFTKFSSPVGEQEEHRASADFSENYSDDSSIADMEEAVLQQSEALEGAMTDRELVGSEVELPNSGSSVYFWVA